MLSEHMEILFTIICMFVGILYTDNIYLHQLSSVVEYTKRKPTYFRLEEEEAYLS